MNLQRIATAALACGLSLAVSAVAAQSKYPSRPIVIVVPYAAGGSTDVITRIVAQHLSNSLGSPVVVENKPGANALIGTEAVAKAANDGYTFLAASNGNSINHSLFGERGASFPRDFTPVVGLASTPNVIAVHPSIPYKSLQDLIDAAKAKPRSINYAHAGVGSLQNLVGEQFAMAAGIQLSQGQYTGLLRPAPWHGRLDSRCAKTGMECRSELKHALFDRFDAEPEQKIQRGINGVSTGEIIAADFETAAVGLIVIIEAAHRRMVVGLLLHRRAREISRLQPIDPFR